MEKMSGTIPGLNVEKHRVSLQEMGGMLGQQIYTLDVKNADPKYNEKMRNNLLVPSRPIRMIVIVRTDITSVRAEVDANSFPVVIINEGQKSELRLQVTKPEFSDVKVSSVRECIQALEDKKSSFYFRDCEALVKEVAMLNNQQRAMANDLAKEVAQQSAMIEDLIAIQAEEQRRYLETSRRTDDIEVKVTITD